ncbi:SoxR reducing system RseC family protein [Shewanella sp. AS16]|uniref:SoxR reducing system RseC family protein n=1 Tax=Shewanella sp. AS16 TaxID=2907625 RepID=UPI001F206BA0|nr:SoxR reducing system RseC family protein [Shewanella sp. AS16]MCE9685325.1 SoxR reducing system RseC family protein [Shewanella sp. AS16]
MMEEMARVVSYDASGWATVEVEIKSGCNHCASSESCGTSAVAKAFSPKTQQFSIPCDQACRPGELLKLGLPESVILKAAALVYLLPLLGLFVGAGMGLLMASGFALAKDPTAIVFGACGALLSWYWGRRLAAKLEAQAQPVVLAYLGAAVSLQRQPD